MYFFVICILTPRMYFPDRDNLWHHHNAHFGQKSICLSLSWNTFSPTQYLMIVCDKLWYCWSIVSKFIMFQTSFIVWPEEDRERGGGLWGERDKTDHLIDTWIKRSHHCLWLINVEIHSFIYISLFMHTMKTAFNKFNFTFLTFHKWSSESKLRGFLHQIWNNLKWSVSLPRTTWSFQHPPVIMLQSNGLWLRMPSSSLQKLSVTFMDIQ